MNEVYTDLEDDARGRKSIDYKDITKEDIEKIIKEAFYGECRDKPDMSYDELRAKLLSGYWYKIDTGDKIPIEGERKIVANTGHGGAKLYLDTCEATGMPASFMGRSLFTHLDDRGWHCILDVNVTKTKQNEPLAGV